MTPELLYLCGVICLWGGMAAGLRAAFLALKNLTAPPELREWKGAITAGLLTAGLLLASRIFNLDTGRNPSGAYLPIVWVYMVFPGWMALGGVVFAVTSGVKAYTAVQQRDRTRGLAVTGVWILVTVVGVALMFRGGDRVWIFRGYLPIDFTLAAGFVVLAAVSVALMVAAQRYARLQGVGERAAATAALLVGCVIFGAPLIWQLLASVKEDVDQSNSKGFIWVPKVQETVPFMDEKRPLLLSKFEGQEVQATLDTDLGDGKVLLEIDRPFSLRGRRFETSKDQTKEIPRNALVFSKDLDRKTVKAFVVEEKENGVKRLRIMEPSNLKGQEFESPTEKLTAVRNPGIRYQNYTEALEWLPNETKNGLVYLNNTLILVVLNVLGTLFSCATVGYGFARLRFPGKDLLFTIMLSTMMLPGAVTMMPQFLIFSSLGWVDTLHPLWVPSLFAGAFNVFLVRQFFSTVPMELEEAARIDGCGYWKTFFQIMLPQVKPALAAIGVWTFMGTWNNFMGPLIYISSPEKMPLVYALAMFRSDRGGDIGMLMAFSTMTMLPILLLFFVAQRFFIEGVQLSGLGGR